MDERRQAATLAGVQAGVVVIVCIFIAVGERADGMAPWQVWTMAASWALLAALTAAGARWRFGGWYLLASLLGSTMVLDMTTAVTPFSSIQLVAGAGLIVLGVFSGHLLSGPGLVVFVTVTSAGYLVALAWNPQLLLPALGPVVVLLFAVNTWQVRALVSRLERAAVTDPLTGALNRNGLLERCSLVVATAQRARRPVSVVVLDLDHFKQFNDKFGHRAGDDLLSGLVSSWHSVLRPSDLVARIGGDEFVIVLPNCDEDEAASTLERLREVSGSGWTAGVVDWPPGLGILEVIDRADQVMYVAKQARD